MRITMRYIMPSLAAFCLLVASAAQPANAQTNANVDICAAGDESAVSPPQRIAACTALIETVKDTPKGLAPALGNRGGANWDMNNMSQAFPDLDRAIALDPKNSRPFRDPST